MIDMKKALKFFTSMVTIFLLGFLLTDTSYASSNVLESNLLKGNQVKISVTNDQTGEVTFFSPLEAQKSAKVNSIKAHNKSIEVGYDVFIPTEFLNPSGIQLSDSKGGQSTSGGVTAKLYVDYDVSANNEKVKLNKVYGSWNPSSSLYYLTNRKVDAHSGYGTGNKLSKTPTSNSFSYTTGWGYNNRLLGDLSPRAWSSATVNVSGMSATHTIKVEFTYSS